MSSGTNCYIRIMRSRKEHHLTKSSWTPCTMTEGNIKKSKSVLGQNIFAFWHGLNNRYCPWWMKVHPYSLLWAVCWRHFYSLFQMILYKDYHATDYYTLFMCQLGSFLRWLVTANSSPLLLFTWQQGASPGGHKVRRGSVTNQQDFLVQQQGHLSQVPRPPHQQTLQLCLL